MIKDDCIFCKIAKGDIPSATIYETGDFKCILDVAPANKGHALIITKEHYDNIFQLDAETAAKIFSFATVAAKAIKEETGCEGMNVLQNNGAVAGQTVNHFHLHLVPRNTGDGVNMSWAPKETVAEEQQTLAKAIKSRI
ncbi:MAG: HIT family protein [Lachnospiraceae bacterium]|nr:HIT family protein [Lachnospiraceae bacterium]MBQ9935533.1 HIT family protein [Lachnospiraceae bacterium]